MPKNLGTFFRRSSIYSTFYIDMSTYFEKFIFISSGPYPIPYNETNRPTL